MTLENINNFSTEDLIKANKIKGDQDFFFFASYICEFGFNPDPKGPRITEDQRELCNFLQAVYEDNLPKIQEYAFKSLDSEYKKQHKIEKPEDVKINDIDSLILCPRGTLKSTVLQAFALWIVCKKPDSRILFYGEVHEQAQKRLAVIKQVITSCRTFRLCYGNLDGSLKKLPWNENIAVVATRKNMAIREATFETAGLDVVVNSRHFDWIFPDDLHSEKNTGSKEQIESVAEKVRLLTPLLDEGSKMVFAGVFWNDSDFHTQLVEGGKCNVFKRSAYVDEKETVSAYPNVFSVKTLKAKAGKMSDSEFSCHYKLSPISGKTQIFPKERFGIIKRGDFQTARNILLIDPAGDPTSQNIEKRDSDYYALELWSLNSTQDFMLSDGFCEICSPTDAIQYAMALILRYKPFIIGIERAGMGNMKHYLQEEIHKKGVFAILSDLLPGGRSKFQRVVGWEPYVKLRKVFIAEECPIKEDFLSQVTRISVSGIKAKRDDLIDPFGYLQDVVRDYGTPASKEPDEDEIPAELMHLNESSINYHMSRRKREMALQSGSSMGEFNV